jgi:hypothetical protein
MIVAIVGYVLFLAFSMYAASKLNFNTWQSALFTVCLFFLPAVTGPFLYWYYLHNKAPKDSLA